MIVICPFCNTQNESDPGMLWVRCSSCHESINLTSLGTRPKVLSGPLQQDLVGTRFGEYRLEELIGVGGMGVVYRASDSKGRVLAVKILYYSAEGNEIVRKRFERETEILEKLNHKNIMKCLAKGEHGPYLYIVMEYVPLSLAQRLRRSPLSCEEIRGIMVDITDALASAHAMQIIHRDLKPTNILLAAEGAKIADFGIAHADYDKDRTSLTQTAAILGTFNYMSPEQRLGEKNLDGRSDIYSLGVLLYELFTGRVPIGHFPRVSQLRRDVPTNIDSVIEKALNQERAKRYEDVRQFREAFIKAVLSPKRRQILRTGFAVGLGALALALFFLVYTPEKKEPVSKNQPTDIRAIMPAGPLSNSALSKNDNSNLMKDLPANTQVTRNVEEGYLSAASEPPAALLIDGKETGLKTPLSPKNPLKLPAGKHQVGFVLASGERYDYEVSIAAGQTTRLVRDFRKQTEIKAKRPPVSKSLQTNQK